MFDKMAFFVYVVRTGSISAAAEKLNISVSAGSRWLQELESKFGLSLYRRSNRLLKPTPAGKKLFDEFSAVVDNAESVYREMQNYQQHNKGHIDIVCAPAYANHYLVKRVSHYLSLNPDVTFNIYITPWALDYAANADITINALASYQGFRERSLHLVRREVAQDQFVAVASKKFLSNHPEPVEPNDLLSYPCLFSTTLTGSNDWIFTKDGNSQIIKVPKTLEINDSDLLLQAARQDVGIAYLPKFVVQPHLDSGELKEILRDFETSIWSLSVYYHPQGVASAVAMHFKDFLLENPIGNAKCYN